MKLFSRKILAVCTIGLILSVPHLFAEDGKNASGAAPASTEAKMMTNSDVETLIKVTDQAATEKKADLMEPLLADDLKVIVTNVPSPQGPQKMEMKKSDYLQTLKQTWEAAEKYEYQKKDVAIELAKDGKSAVVKDTIIEKLTISGKTIETTTKEMATIEFRNGKPQITILEGEMVEMK